MIKKKAARTAFYPAHGIEMNITDEIGRKTKTLFADFILQTNVIDFMVLFTCIPTDRRAGFFRLLQMEWRKKKEKAKTVWACYNDKNIRK